MGYIYKLMFRANLIKCTNMQPNDGFNYPFSEYKFTLTCGKCGVEVDAIVRSDTQVPYQHFDDHAKEEDEETNMEETKILAKLQARDDVLVHFNQACECCGKHMCIKMIPIENGNGRGLTDSPDDNTILMNFFIHGATPSNYQADKTSWQVTRLVDETLHAFYLECDDEKGTTYSYSYGDAFSSIYLEIANAKFYFSR